jgi:hypothetical protein
MKNFKQMKAWPTRRIHLFPEDESKRSSCGLVTQGQSFFVMELNGDEAMKLHKYDDLNFCQTCRRILMKDYGQKYVPLSTIYQKPGVKNG